MKPVACDYRTKNGEPCPCGNKEIPPGDARTARLWGKEVTLNYCPLALALMRAEEAEFNKKFQYENRKNLKKK